MCTNPNDIGNGVKVACRVCNDCIGARKNDWVARSVAETAVSGWAGVVSLTYDDSEASQDGSKAFRYKDVNAFMKRLREDMAKKLGRRPNLRFIVAGERGSKRGRVHWHCILWADEDPFKMGIWATFKEMWQAGYKPSQGPIEQYRIANYRLREKLVWSMWPYGHVYLDEVNQETASYVLKYALKDQFNVVKAKGTKRFTKSELHSASFFRMSKQPPIGDRWLEQRLSEWADKRVVPTSLQLKIEGYKGYWWPKGKLREKLLYGLHEINERIREETGRDAPQWSTLLASVGVTEALEKDWCILKYGEILEVIENEKEAQERFARRAAARRDYEASRKCGGPYVCLECARGFSAEIYEEYLKAIRSWYRRYQAEGSGENFERWYRKNKTSGSNPFCQLSTPRKPA